MKPLIFTVYFKIRLIYFVTCVFVLAHMCHGAYVEIRGHLAGHLAWKRFRAESLEKDTLQPVELRAGCIVCSRFPDFVSCHHAGVGLRDAVSIPVSNPSLIFL